MKIFICLSLSFALLTVSIYPEYINAQTITPCYVFSEDLNIGSNGPDVVVLQTWLISHGFDIPSISNRAAPKGYYGNQTAYALSRYQNSISIASGSFDSATRERVNDCKGSSIVKTQEKIIEINKNDSCPFFPTDLKLEDKKEDVSILQSWLIEHGFDVPSVSSGEVPSGKFGRQTESAVMAYQRSVGLTASGVFNSTTRTKVNTICNVVVTPTPTPIISPTPSVINNPSPNPSPILSPRPSASVTPTPSYSPIPTTSSYPTATPSPSISPSSSPSPTPSPTPSPSLQANIWDIIKESIR